MINKSLQRLKDIIGEKQTSQVRGSSSEDSVVLSPFEEDKSAIKVGPMVGLGGGLEFNKENVDKVLDEVRPYLIADGGNVAVVEVDTEGRNVKLLLEGACGSCPSSTTTMKMGIERVLKENFANLGEIIAISPPDKAKTALTVDSVMQALAPVLPAVKAMGGAVEVDSVDQEKGAVIIRYRGPAKLKQGVELVLLDMDTVDKVIFVDNV